MSVSAAQASAFYSEARREGSVWSVHDGDGFPAPLNADGDRAMPFWSLRSRAERVIASTDAYRNFVPVQISLAEFRERWLSGLADDGLRVGLNWSGPAATGYDLHPADVAEALAGVDPAK